MPDSSAACRADAVLIDELPCVRLVCPQGEALIAIQGAQLLSYRPAGQQPVVWLSEQAQFKAGQPLRGGIPVCWPWFGDLARNPPAVRAMHRGGPEAPAHGLVRALDWERFGTSCDTDSVSVRFRLAAPAGLDGWPHAVELELHVRLGGSLQLELITRNTGDAPLAISQALHTYLAVSDSRRATVSGLDGVAYLDTLDGWGRKVQQGPVHIEGETDRLYLGIDQPLIVHDEGWQRDIHLRARHSSSAVVWNPWVEKSRRLSQFADDAWQTMLCIETARVADDLLIVAPGETGAMSVDIRAQPRP